MSSTSKPTSKAEAKEEHPYDFAGYHENTLHALVNEQSAKDVFWLLIAFRFVNSLCMKTFFQPDEYFQALEPAWQMAFGSESGAWITWEWHHQLRSSLHPALFAAVYAAFDKPMAYLQFFPQFRAMILTALPSATQSIFAGIGDYYTWQLAEKLYGVGSTAAWTTVLLAVFSPWEWFCSTRTFSSSLETTLTIAALYYWPWQLTIDNTPWINAKSEKKENDPTSKSSNLSSTLNSVTELRISLLLAATACILRPTNLLIWFTVLMPTVSRLLSTTSPTSRVPLSDYLILLREGIICGSVVLLVSAWSDYLYFGEWTFPPYQWLYFNLAQNLAVFYGRNDWHYFLSQGLPLLLTTYTPFAIVALWKATTASGLRFLFATTVFTTLASLSLISHKEVRFIFPLLPILHILTAPTISSFFYTTTSSTKAHSPPRTHSKTTTELTTRRPLLLTLLLLLNLSISAYTTLTHQRGVLSVTTFLRSEYERLALDPRGLLLSHPDANRYETEGWGKKNLPFDEEQVFAGFLMPCHSTPWRSRLFYPGLHAWALTCEPPLSLGPEERGAYRDEADRFYDDPVGFLEREVNTRERPWPRYVVGFEGVGGWLREYYEGTMKGFEVREVWRGGNGHWHDDWRRRGDVVVWEFVDGSLVEEG